MNIDKPCACPCSTSWLKRSNRDPSTDYHKEGFCVSNINCGSVSKYRGYGELGSPTDGVCGCYDAVIYDLNFRLSKCIGKKGETVPGGRTPDSVKEVPLPVDIDCTITLDVESTNGANIQITGIPIDYEFAYDEFGNFVYEFAKATIAFTNTGIACDDTKICYRTKHTLCCELDNGLEPAQKMGGSIACDECATFGSGSPNFADPTVSQCPETICIKESPKNDGYCPDGLHGGYDGNTGRLTDRVGGAQYFYPPQSSVNPE